MYDGYGLITFLSYSNFLCCHLFYLQPDAGRKKSSVRNRVIIAVTCAVITAMVITGVLVGVWFFLDSTVKIVEVFSSFTQ